MSIDILLQSLEEIFYFNSFESFLYLSMFILLIKILNKIVKKNKILNKVFKVTDTNVNNGEFIFHLITMSILNYVLSNIFSKSLLIQLINILGICIYLCIVFKVNIFKSILINLLSFIFLFVMEMSLCVLYQYVFSINIIGMSNMTIKFLYMIPFRCIEIFIIIKLYSFERKWNCYEENIQSTTR